jgi:ATP-dependent DNA helicase PIF1
VDFFNWNEDLHPELAGRSGWKIVRNGHRLLISLEGHRYEEELCLKKGTRVILLQNINVSAGLVNGAQGEVIDFEYDPNPPTDAVTTTSEQEQFYQFVDEHEESRWPVVDFGRGLIHTIYPHCDFSPLGKKKPYSKIGRTQIPLLPAWAITFNKSQGMTLDSVIVDLDKCFLEEQVYVALSRATSLKGLKVKSLPRPGRFREGMNAEVEQSYKKVLGKKG